jgi:hypothetical protein
MHETSLEPSLFCQRARKKRASDGPFTTGDRYRGKECRPRRDAEPSVKGTRGLLYFLLLARRPQRAEAHTLHGQLVFVFKSNAPNELIPINPLGLAITYFREDEAFN